MRAVLAPDIIRMWEAGRDQAPIERALTLLAAGEAEISREELAALSIGRRDSRLLEIRRRIFGDALSGFAECPQCAGRLEVHFASGTIQTEANEAAPALELERDGVFVRFRLPTSSDLGEVVATDEIEEAKAELLRRCVIEARRESELVPTEEFSADLVEEINRRLADADPGAEVLLDLRCSFCEHSWQTLFDIAAFFWKEISAHARRLLREVDALARAYGWGEAEILGLSAARRQAYLELIGA